MRPGLPTLAFVIAALIVWSASPAGQVTIAGAPTILNGFGNTPTIASRSGAGTFRVNVGTGGTVSSGTVALPAADNGWNCLVQGGLGGTTTKATQSTSTGVMFVNYGTGLLTTAWQASEVLTVICNPY